MNDESLMSELLWDLMYNDGDFEEVRKIRKEKGDEIPTDEDMRERLKGDLLVVLHHVRTTHNLIGWGNFICDCEKKLEDILEEKLKEGVEDREYFQIANTCRFGLFGY